MFKNLTKPGKEFMKLVLHLLFFFHLVWFRLFFLHWNTTKISPNQLIVLLSGAYLVCIRVWRIYSNIRIFEYIGLKYLFGHSFGSILFVPIYLDIRWGKICLYEYIQTFVHECVREWKQAEYSNIRTIFNTNIYSDIRSCKIFYSNIFGHSFV